MNREEVRVEDDDLLEIYIFIFLNNQAKVTKQIKLYTLN